MATQIGKTVQYRIGGPDTGPVYRAARITTVATDTVCNLSIDTEIGRASCRERVSSPV